MIRRIITAVIAFILGAACAVGGMFVYRKVKPTDKTNGVSSVQSAALLASDTSKNPYENPDDPNTGGVFSAAVAEFTVGRLMEDEDVRLEARRKSDGKLVFSINMIDMALLVKSANLRSMDDQEYLDRLDDYNFIFFLDSNLRWTQVQINILSWTVVYNNTEL